MLTIPKSITAPTGLDAFYHAMEAYLANCAFPISDIFAIRSMKLAAKYLKTAFNKGDDMEAREGMALASTLAGYSITSSSTTLLHAIGHSISGYTNIAHGLALSAILEPWTKFTFPSAPERFTEVLKILGTDLGGMDIKKAAIKAAEAMQDLKASVDVDITIKKAGLDISKIDNIADDTFSAMQGCVDVQPGDPVTKKDVLIILKEAFKL